MTYDLEHLGRQVDKLSDAIEENTSEKGENNMNDIAGLLALMQGNKGMDLPGLLALCKEKGYDRSFGGEGMFMFVFLILFLFAGGGWNRLGVAGQQAFENVCHQCGVSCQEIIGLHDRISAAQAASTQGFFQLDTKLCSSIAEVMAAVRNQGDRTYDATRNVGDTVRDCCCKLEASLASLNCKVDGVSRDIRESSGLINAKIELEALKQENARAAMECRILQRQKDCCCEMNQRFDRLECTINTNRLADENAVHRLENFAIQHYKVTNVPSAAAGAIQYQASMLTISMEA